MIVRYVDGNLVTMVARANKIGKGITAAHGCNCHDAMHSGIAWEFARNFPAVRNADTKAYEKATQHGYNPEGNIYLLGNSSAAIVGNCTVINLYTQFYPGKDCRYDAIENAFKHLESMNIKGNVYIPQIGAGIAGGDWNKISEIINNVTPNTSIVVVKWDGTIHDEEK